ncbi:MAG: HU family DNA-binding protein [Actinobacteria bacterium]|nr:HU family DNA-binding protein [Actinomycetota bacterium]
MATTKKELVDAVASDAGLSKTDAASAVDAVLNAITDALKKGEKVQLPGFGSFEVKERKERQGINPKTGEKITIAATKAPTFKAGKGLKTAVAG